jgi:hypothetical protein
MKNFTNQFVKVFFLALILSGSSWYGIHAQALPELLYYKFDIPGTSIPNDALTPVGNNPASITGTGLSIGGIGLSGTALQGTGVISSSGVINTNWNTNLSGSFTIGFWTSNITPSTTLWYIFGDAGAGTFRCFTNGVASANNWMVRGGGLPDLAITGAATASPNYIHVVYNAPAGTYTSYVNGVLNTTVTAPTSNTMSGNGFQIGGYGTNSNLSGLMDEFRIYNRALSLAEIQATYSNTLIQGPCTTAVAGVPTASSQSICFGTSASISAIGSSMGFGSMYQWQSSPDGVTWTNMLNDTNMAVSVSPTDTTFYRMYVNCGSLADTSVSIRIDVLGTPLSGTYTINQNAPVSATNFTSFNDFFDAMVCGGVSGPVVANVVPNTGPYIERVEVGVITGVSSVNTITVNGNGNLLEYSATGSADRTTLLLDGTDYLIVDSLNIEANGTANGWVLQLMNGADHNTFTNCRFETSTSATGTLFSNVVMSGSPTSATTTGNSGNYNTFHNNLHIGGYYGFTMMGVSSATQCVGNTVTNSVFEDFYLYGMYIYGQDGVTIVGNDISRANRTTLSTFYGLFFTTGISGAKVMNNRIHDNSNQNMTTTNAAYPIYLSSATGSAGNPNIMANNLVYNINNGGTIYLIYLVGTANDYWNIYHNTCVIDEPSQTSTSVTRMVFMSGAQANMNIKNNIFYLDRGTGGTQHIMYLSSALTATDINNNVYYAPNSVTSIGFSGSNLATFSDWQNAGYDANGIEFDPAFIGGTGNDFLRPSAAVIKFLGANVLLDVPTDIDGDPRTPAPDPGAYQFEPPQGIDIGIIRYTSPSGACPGTVDVTIEVGSFASDTAETIRINWTINGAPQTPVIVTDTFYPGNIVSITLGTFNLTASGVFNISATVDSVYPGPDIDFANNTLDFLGYRAGLSGTFTINQLAGPSATNFTSFSDFVDVLNSYGVCGPVIANVVSGSGPYNERLVFNQINGASSTNTITINGNGNTLSYAAAGDADRTTVTLNGTDYLTIDSLNIEATGSTHGWVMYIANGADYNTIKNCRLETSTSSTSTFYSNVVMSGSPTSGTTFGNTGNYNTFDNNIHIGGYYGFTLMGIGVNDRMVGNKVLNSVFEDFYLYGMYVGSQDDIEIIGNDISRINRATVSTFYGILMTSGTGNAKVMNNRIHDIATNTTTTTGAYVLYLSSATGSAGNPNIMANNLVYNINNDGLVYAMYLLGTANNYWNIYHNTVVVDFPSGTSASAARTLFVSAAQADMNIKNNIFYLDRGGSPQHLAYLTSGMPASSSVDHNVYYSPNTNAGYYSSSALTDFAAWQNAGFDANGLEFNPQFLGTGNDYYRPTVGAVKSLGDNVLSDVPEDIEGVARTTTPDPGVYQFTPLPCTGAYNYTLDTLYPGGAAISWTSPSTEWQVEWDICGFVPGSGMGNLDSVVTNNTNYQLPNLPMGQCVCVFVREKCPSGGYGNWTGPVEICVPIEDDAEMLSIINPENLSCGDSTLNVIVAIRNNGFNAITSLPITVEITGAITQTLSMTYTGNLLETEVDTVVVGTVNLYSGGYINIEAFTGLPGDQNTSNDTLRIDSMIVIPFAPVVDNNVYCPGDDSVTVSAMPIPAGGYNWFDVATGGTPISSGNSVTVPTTQGALYVEYQDVNDSLTTTLTGGSSCGAGNMFDLIPNTTLSLTAFTVRPVSTQTNAPISIYYVVGGYLGTTQSDWTLIETGVLPNAVANTPIKFNLTTPFTIQGGVTYGIYVNYNASYGTTANTYSNADLTFISGNGNCSAFDYCCSPRTFNGIIHYGSDACSDIRTPVTLTPADTVIADFNYDEVSFTVNFFNASQNADSVRWDFAGLGTAIGDTVSFQFPQTDSFDVCMIAYGPCGTDTICKRVWAHNVSVTGHSLAASLQVFPNPSEGKFTLRFNQQQVSDVSIELLDLSGKSVWMEHHTRYSGVYSRDFDRGDLAAGVYILRINNRDGIITRRVVINK